MIIETERLILRPFREKDAVDVFEYLKDPMVNCFACMKVHSLEEAQKAVMERAEDAEYTFARSWACARRASSGSSCPLSLMPRVIPFMRTPCSGPF